jgi:hypothetical protein
VIANSYLRLDPQERIRAVEKRRAALGELGNLTRRGSTPRCLTELACIYQRELRGATSAPSPAASYEHRPECSILLAVNQELGEGTTLRVTPKLADPLATLEVREHQDVEQFGTGSRPKGVQAGL